MIHERISAFFGKTERNQFSIQNISAASEQRGADIAEHPPRTLQLIFRTVGIFMEFLRKALRNAWISGSSSEGQRPEACVRILRMKLFHMIALPGIALP